MRRQVEFQISDFKFQSLQSLELPRATALEKRKRRDCFSPCRGRLSHGWPEPRAAGTAGTVYDIMRGEQHLTRGTFRTRGLARVGWRQAGKKRLVTATSQGRNGKRHVISETQFVPGEENDDESDLGGGPMQLGADNGDAGADGEKTDRTPTS